MLSEPWMTTGPGPPIEPSSVTDAKLKPPTDTSKPAEILRLEVERPELHDSVDLDEAVRLDAEADADLEPPAELDRVGRDREVALGPDVDDRDRVVDRQPDPAHRREWAGSGLKPG